MKKIAVLGIGNILLKDDGIGVRAVEGLISKYGENHNGIQFVDGGTSILDLLHIFTDYEKVIVVDSLKGGHTPGSIYRITPEEMGGIVKGNTSLHDVQVLDMVGNAKLLGHNPEIVIIGIEPLEITYEMELSPLIEGRLPELKSIVEAEVGLDA